MPARKLRVAEQFILGSDRFMVMVRMVSFREVAIGDTFRRRGMWYLKFEPRWSHPIVPNFPFEMADYRTVVAMPADWLVEFSYVDHLGSIVPESS